MRIRSIKPEFCTDEKIGGLSREERLHFILLWMVCDRNGVIEFRPRQLAAQLYPYDHDMTNDRFKALTSAVLQKCLCSHFSHDGRDFIRVNNFTKHQALTSWEKKQSTPLIPLKSLQQCFSSASEALPSEERRGEEIKEPPNPQGGLSDGELRFVPMLDVLSASGKVADGVSELVLAHYWRSVEPGSDPCDAEWLEDLRAKLAGHTGRIGQLDPWLRKRASEFFSRKNNASGHVSVGPPVEEM